jgi:hypothetical protein
MKSRRRKTGMGRVFKPPRILRPNPGQSKGPSFSGLEGKEGPCYVAVPSTICGGLRRITKSGIEHRSARGHEPGKN